MPLGQKYCICGALPHSLGQRKKKIITCPRGTEFSYLQYVPNLCEFQSISKKLVVKAWLRVQCDNAKWRCLFTFCLWISSCRFCCCLTVGKQVDEERWMRFPRGDYSSARQLGSVLLWVLFLLGYQEQTGFFFSFFKEIYFISWLHICIHFISCLLNECFSIM